MFSTIGFLPIRARVVGQLFYNFKQAIDHTFFGFRKVITHAGGWENTRKIMNKKQGAVRQVIYQLFERSLKVAVAKQRKLLALKMFCDSFYLFIICLFIYLPFF